MSGTSGLRRHGHTSAGDGGTISLPSAADDVTYDNSGSGLAATDVQGAIDEIDGTVDGLGDPVDISDDAANITGVNFAEQGSNPASPAAGHRILFTKSGGVYAKDSSGNVTGPLVDGSSALTPSSLVIPGASSPAQTAEGSAVWDTDDDKLTIGTGAGRKTLVNEGGSLSLLGAPTGDLSIGSHKITSVTDPASAQDAATKAYVDATVAGAGGLSDHGVITYLDATVAAAPADPSAGRIRIYAKTGGHLAQRDSSGTETLLDSTGGGSVATDAIFDAKGDLAVGTGADTAAKLTVGANDTIPMADSAETTGIKWVGSQTPSTQAFSDAAAQGTADTYARGDHKHGMPASPGALSGSTNQLGADVTMTTGGTYYDGPSITLSAGTWLLIGTITHDGQGNGTNVTAKLWDGTTVGASSEAIDYGGASNRQVTSITLSWLVTTAGTPTWKISATSNGNTTIMRAAAPDNAAGNTASTLVAIKIA